MAAVTPATAGAMPAGGASAAAGNTTLPVAIVVSSRPVAGGQSRQRQMAKTQHGLRGAGANSFQEPVIVGPNNGGLK